MSKVSIIIPVYNSESYLGWCINSVLKQTYRDLEVILVNDGSTDSSIEICKNYQKIDNRVKVIDVTNGGVSKARNIGIANACSEYIQFMDSDDVIHPEMTENLVDRMENYNADVVFCDMEMIYLYEGHVTEKMKMSNRPLGKEVVLTKKLFFDKFPYILWHNSILEGPCNKLYKRQIIEEKGLLFPEDFSLGEDFLFNMKYYEECSKVVILNQSYYYYLQHNQEALTRKYHKDYFKLQIHLISTVIDMLLRQKVGIYKYENLIANYLLGHVYKGIVGLLKSDLTESEKKAQLYFAITHPLVRECFKVVDYIPDKMWQLKNNINNYDMEEILNICQGFLSTVNIEPTSVAEKNEPGKLNQALVKVANYCNKDGRNAFLNEWTRDLKKYGIKLSLKKRVWRVNN